jgi:hypothetical protein
MLRHPIFFTDCSLLSVFVLGLLLKYLRMPDAFSDEEEAEDDDEEEEDDDDVEEEEDEEKAAADDEFAIPPSRPEQFARLLLSRSHWKYSVYADSSGRRA